MEHLNARNIRKGYLSYADSIHFDNVPSLVIWIQIRKVFIERYYKISIETYLKETLVRLGYIPMGTVCLKQLCLW